MRHALVHHACIVALGLLLAAVARADRTVEVATDDALRAALRDARPGDTLRIASGVYRGGIYAQDLHGTKAQPIALTAADPNQPPIIRGGNVGIHLVNPRHVTLSDLTIEQCKDNGLNIDDGGTMQATAQDVTLTKLTVRDIGPQGNHDGIKLSGVRDLLVTRCTLERWGDGGSGIDMVGCHEGRITECVLRNRDASAATGVQAKGGCTGIVIDRCRFEHAARRAINLGGSTGEAFFRPPLQPDGNAEARNVRVEACVFIGSDAPVAFTTSVHCSVTDNIIYRPSRWVLRLLQEQPLDRFVSSGDHTFAANTIIWRKGDLHAFVNVGPNTRPDTMRFVGNTWYCEDDPTPSTPTLPAPEHRGVHGQRPPEEVWKRISP